ncbi:hypothetical protein AB2M95_02440 [Pseudomonas chlororaphis]|uniref:hypothetical protein n=1 Tax=Pseudomonas chlororaphis TaxID=587753 RepID=UPI0034622A38
MSEYRKLTQAELSQALKLSESEIARYISDNEPMADGSGHWVFFSLEAPESVLSRLRVGSDLRLALGKSWSIPH